jgi:hypothetical protein
LRYIDPLLAITCIWFARAVSAQNLLTNPGFDRGLDGWAVTTQVSPEGQPELAQATAAWDPADAEGSSVSGSATLHALANIHMSIGEVFLRQCVPAPPGNLLSFRARVKTVRQFATSTFLRVSPSSTLDCSPQGSGAIVAALSIATVESDSASEWRSTGSAMFLPAGSRSVLFEILARAAAGTFYGKAYVDSLVDDTFLGIADLETSTWIVPSVAFTGGAEGSHWRTDVTLANPSVDDAIVRIRFITHDTDARSAHELALVIEPRATVVMDDLLNRTFGLSGTYGALVIDASSPALVVQAETSTPRLSQSGSVGQSLPAAGPADLIRQAQRSIAPVREDVLSRTNLVLANATDLPLGVDVTLFDADGRVLGTKTVSLLPLGMTQLDRVVAQLGVATLPVGRLELSTQTPGGAFAAYASVIDNRSNDPRTILAR